MNAATTSFPTFIPEVLGQIVPSVTRNKTTLVKMEDVMPERSATNAVRYVAKDNKGKKYFGTIKVCDFGEIDKTYFFIEDGLTYPAEDAEAATPTTKPFESGVVISINLKWIEDLKGDVGRLEGKCKEFVQLMNKDKKKEKSSRNIFRTSMENGVAVMRIDGQAFRIICQGFLNVAEPAMDFLVAVAKMNFSKLIGQAGDLMSAKLKLRGQEIDAADTKK